jgi:phage gp37-like protein
VRTAVRTYTFTGRVQPIRAGQIVSVFAHTASGDVLVGRGRVGYDGIWSASHRFTGTGTFGLFAVTGADIVNAAGRSATVATAVR